MPDHCHVLLTLASEGSISGLVRKLHSAFARRWRGQAGDEAPAPLEGVDRRTWQTRFYDHVVRDEEAWRTKLSYMHENPVRAGLVDSPTDYTWSSAMFWETGTGPVACDGTMW